MAEFESDIAAVGKSFADVGMQAAAASNKNRARIARQNIDATTAQLELEETVARKDIARALAVNQGTLAANAAWKGGGGDDQAQAAALYQASEIAVIATANKVNKELAFIASQEFIQEDPLLAAFQSGVEGVQYGMSIAQSLLAEGKDTTRITRTHLGTQSYMGVKGGLAEWQVDHSRFMDTPGFDFGKYLGLGE
jgi:hypothetical protein